MNRILGMVIVGVWLVAMAALVRRDVLPYWLADEAPPTFAANAQYQYAIHNTAKKRIGTSWVTSVVGPQLTTVRSTTRFDLRGLAGILPHEGTVYLDTDLTYAAGSVLEEFRFTLSGAGVPIQILGERYGNDYACTAEIGETRTTLPLDTRQSEALGELLRPFTHLENLHVGRTWRMRLFDPFALIKSGSVEFTTQLVTVTARETIVHQGRSVDCYRIEMPDAAAWADDQGRVLRQEVRLPLLGRWTISLEPFDESQLIEALRRVGRGYRGKPPERRPDGGAILIE